jgi:hypothetical protein
VVQVQSPELRSRQVLLKTAPGGTGSHTSRWQLFNAGGTAFGTKPYVQISVP